MRAVAEEIEIRLPSQLRTTDEGIAERIAQILSWSSALRHTDIQAEVRRGHVTLIGSVDWFYQKQEAAQRVSELAGITGLTNEIHVRQRVAPSNARDVQRQIMSALHRHASIEASKVRVSVAGGKVTLDGTVDAYRERELIEDAARAAPGVEEIVDNLTVA